MINESWRKKTKTNGGGLSPVIYMVKAHTRYGDEKNCG